MVTGVVGSASVIINIMIASIFSFKILLVFFSLLDLRNIKHSTELDI